MNMQSFRLFPRRRMLGIALAIAMVPPLVMAAGPQLTPSQATAKMLLKNAPSWNPKPGIKDLGKAAKDEYDKLNKGLEPGKEALKQLKEYYDTLTEGDKKMEADFQPPGAPSVPSKCMEDKACKPCYTEAYGNVNKTRKYLEQVRARYEFTHRFTTEGKAYMQGVANVAGGIAALGAQVEAEKVDGALADFDKVVRNKNTELLERLEKNLREVSVCEAKFYKNEDWYDRYGYMYYQFMLAHYSY